MFIRRLPEFEYHTPATLPEALGLMGRYGETAPAHRGGHGSAAGHEEA